MVGSIPTDGPVPPELLALSPPWNRTPRIWEADLKPTHGSVETALDALAVSLALNAAGWRPRSPFGEGSGLPERFLESPRWINVFNTAMPVLSDITWPRLREAASTGNPRWRALYKEDPTDEQLAVLGRLWIEDIISGLIAGTIRWLRDAMPRAARADQFTRACDLVSEYFPQGGFERGNLMSLARYGVGPRATECLKDLERHPDLSAEERLWVEQERRRLQGESPSVLPEFLWLKRGKCLAQIRQVFCLADYESPEPGHLVEITFDDDSAVQIVLLSGGIRFYEGRNEDYWEAPQDYGLHINPGNLYMIDRSEEPQAWPTIGVELAEVEPYFQEADGGFRGVNFYFGDVRMAVREVGDRGTGGLEEHWLDVSWSSVEPSGPGPG